jgi:hypothetical protein
MGKIIMRIAEMLREGIELDMPYTAIESALDYIDDVVTIGERANE